MISNDPLLIGLRAALDAPSAHIEAFYNAIKTECSTVTCRRFSKNIPREEIARRWTVPFFSGWMKRESDALHLTIIEPNQTSYKKTDKKKFKNSIHITIPIMNGQWGEAAIHLTMLKRVRNKTTSEYRFSCYQQTAQVHQALFEAQEKKEGIADYPHLFPVIEKGARSTVEAEERRYIGSFIDVLEEQGKNPYFSLRAGFKALTNVARALDFIHKKRWVHLDVKLANIFIDVTHKGWLADFELVARKGSSLTPGDYFAWDSLMCRLGIASPFTDLFAFSVALGDYIWRKDFFAFDKCQRKYRPTAAPKYFASMMQKNKIKEGTPLYQKHQMASEFITKVFQIDAEIDALIDQKHEEIDAELIVGFMKDKLSMKDAVDLMEKLSSKESLLQNSGSGDF